MSAAACEPIAPDTPSAITPQMSTDLGDSLIAFRIDSSQSGTNRASPRSTATSRSTGAGRAFSQVEHRIPSSRSLRST
jgi:hypothetical protein